MWDLKTMEVRNDEHQRRWLAQRICKTLTESNVRVGDEVKKRVEAFVSELPEIATSRPLY